jgi:hypothetical protein
MFLSSWNELQKVRWNRNSKVEVRLLANKVKRKKRLKNAISNRQRQLEKDALSMAWRNIFVKSGVLKG